jgi:hypothetical protein
VLLLYFELGMVCCAEFKCGIAFDPWWPLLPTNSAALKGWQTNGPLLVLGSQVRWCPVDVNSVWQMVCVADAV